jgi:hypothetical protein
MRDRRDRLRLGVKPINSLSADSSARPRDLRVGMQKVPDAAPLERIPIESMYPEGSIEFLGVMLRESGASSNPCVE